MKGMCTKMLEVSKNNCEGKSGVKRRGQGNKLSVSLTCTVEKLRNCKQEISIWISVHNCLLKVDRTSFYSLFIFVFGEYLLIIHQKDKFLLIIFFIVA